MLDLNIPHPGRRGARLLELAELLDRCCTPPSRLANDEGAERRAHLDLVGRPRQELQQERAVIMLWCSLFPDHDAWLDERLQRLNEVLRHAS